MRRDRLQNRIAGSVFTLPVCVVIAVLVWWMPLGQYRLDYAVGLGLAIFVAYVLLETNNRFQLIRVRSRMVASVWIVSAASIASLHVWHYGTIAALSLAIAHFFLFNTYEKRQPVNESFHAGLFLGIGALSVPWLVVMLPLFLLHQAIYLRSLTFRCLFATLVGMLMPAMAMSVPMVITDDYTRLTDWYQMLCSLTLIGPQHYLDLTLQQALAWLLPALLMLLGGIHYLCTSYNDKIMVRMILYIFVTHSLVIMVFTGLQPQYAELLMPVMLVCGAVLIAHFFALTRSWFTNSLFVLALLLYMALGYFTLWFPTMTMSELLIL